MKNSLFRFLALLVAIGIAIGTGVFANVADKAKERQSPTAKMTGTVALSPKSRLPKLQSKSDGGTITRHRKTSGISRSFTSVLSDAVGNIDLRGSVIASNTPSSVFPRGMYKIPTSDGSDFSLIRSGVLANKGGAVVDNIYYAVTSLSMFGEIWVEIDAYNAETWEPVPYYIEPETSVIASDVTVDPVTGKVYGCFYNDAFDGGYVFGTIDYKTAIRTAIKDIPSEIGYYNAIAADTDGTIYAIDIQGLFYKIDKNSGEPHLIGNTGLKPQYAASATIDPASGRMFWTYSTDTDGALYEVDKTTGTATLLCTFPEAEEVTGLYVASPPAENKAPAPAENVEVVFEDGKLSGIIRFLIPPMLFDGSPAQGEVSYLITANGEKVVASTAECGNTVSAEISLPNSGEYEFCIILSNQTGASPAAKTSSYVGYGIPDAPEVSINYSDGEFTIEWKAPDKVSSGGIIDSKDFTYTVTRYPDGNIIANDISTTRITDIVEEPSQITVFYYTVTAKNHDTVSAPGKSQNWTLGAINPPYFQDFMSDEAMEGFTILDNNNDGQTWKRALFGGNVTIAYNEELAADDWLITPPIRLKSGAIYKLSFDVSSDARYPERLEVKMGKSPVATDMTTTLMDATIYKSSEKVTEEIYITPDSDGNFYIGFHGISDPDCLYLYIHSISISGAISPNAPEAIRDLQIVPDENGQLSSYIFFTPPSLSINGNELDKIEYVEISRNGTVIKRVDYPELGLRQKISDIVPSPGIYTYSATAHNNSGEGKKAVASTYIGINTPQKVPAFTASRTANHGEISFEWSAPVTDKDGFPINPALIRYRIVEFVGNDDVVIADNIIGTEFRYQAISPDVEQEFKQWAIFAKTDNGISGGTDSEMMAVGTPYAMPYSESAPDGNLQHILGTGSDPYVVWDTTTDSPDVASQDGDNGYMYMLGYFKDDEAPIFTGIIHIDDSNPALSLYVFRLTGEDDTALDKNEIDVYISADKTKKLVRTVRNCELPLPAQWNRVSIPLDEYVGKDIELTFVGRLNNFKNIAIDNIRIDRLCQHNLAVESIDAPDEVNPYSPFGITVTVANTGENDISDYKVELSLNGHKIDEKTYSALGTGKKNKIVFRHSFDIISDEHNTFSATVIYDNDENKDDNSKTAEVSLILPNYPTVRNLTGQWSENGIQLNWTEPDLSLIIEDKRMEDFEKAGSFAHKLTDWTLIDCDNAPIGGFNGLTLPGLTTGETKSSFFIFDDTDYNDSFKAYSGHKYLAVLYPANNIQADDWAISPTLSGQTQTISFKARSYHASYPESFEILYSTGSLDPNDFISIEKVDNVPNAWTGYSVELPEGALHFAIRYNAAELFMLMIDDISFIAGTKADNLNLLGYNVYRNGDKLNSQTIGTASFVDTSVSEKEPLYAVTAIYGCGESAPVYATIDNSGIMNPLSNEAKIFTRDNNIIIKNASGCKAIVSTPDGKIVFSGNCETETIITVTTGIYIVKAGNQSIKVIIK